MQMTFLLVPFEITSSALRVEEDLGRIMQTNFMKAQQNVLKAVKSSLANNEITVSVFNYGSAVNTRYNYEP